MSPTPCPICKKPAADQKANPTWPFCCDRCKLIDLGRWLDGKYAIPAQSREAEEEFSPEEEV